MAAQSGSGCAIVMVTWPAEDAAVPAIRVAHPAA